MFFRKIDLNCGVSSMVMTGSARHFKFASIFLYLDSTFCDRFKLIDLIVLLIQRSWWFSYDRFPPNITWFLIFLLNWLCDSDCFTTVDETNRLRIIWFRLTVAFFQIVWNCLNIIFCCQRSNHNVFGCFVFIHLIFQIRWHWTMFFFFFFFFINKPHFFVRQFVCQCNRFCNFESDTRFIAYQSVGNVLLN